MERGDWEDEPDYPHAPVPAHERTWRHPSEMGAGTRVHHEPPLVVGRGLSVVAGIVGAGLAFGLLWLMVPHAGREPEVTVEASSTALRSESQGVTAAIPRDNSTTQLTNNPATTSAGTPPSTSVVTSTSAATVATTAATVTTAAGTTASSPSTAATFAPVPTMLIGEESPAAAIAVALVPGHYVVTTAAAVKGQEGIPVRLPSGEVVVGAVVAINQEHGTAVVSVANDIDDSVAIASEGPPLTDSSYTGSDDAGEGSLVLDDSGHLAGMCTKTAAGMQVIPVEILRAALDAAMTTVAPAWLGIEAEVTSNGVVVADVLAGGPATVAGVRPGDVIDAIDGQLVLDLDALRAILSTHAAGDSLTITLHRNAESTATSTPTVVDVIVTLSQAPGSI